jgi:hypothetical protein
MDKKLAQERLRGWAEFNEWELQEDREKLPRLTVEQSVRQFVGLCRLARSLAPDASEVFREKNIAHRVDMRAKFKQIAERLGCGPPD